MEWNVPRFSIYAAVLFVCESTAADPPRPLVKIVQNGESSNSRDVCRGIIVGPNINQPAPFPGYRGFVGWESPIRLKNGEWLVGFNTGYWHASAPTPLNYSPKMLDGGQTWIAPALDHGFLVDNAYGYGKAMELEDGSLFIVYIATGGRRAEDARNNAIRAVRLRVCPDHSGIELLPAPNRP
jgi:hypothetical protein